MKQLLKPVTLFFLFHGKKMISIGCIFFGAIFIAFLYRYVGRPFAGDAMVTAYYLKAALWVLGGIVLTLHSQMLERRVREIIADLRSHKRTWFLITDPNNEKMFSIHPIKDNRILKTLSRNVDEWQMLSDERLKKLAADPNCKNGKYTRFLLEFY